MQSDKLKACPFCGYDTTLQLCESQTSGWWYVQCNACNIKGPGVSWENKEPGVAACHAWNLRAPDITRPVPDPEPQEGLRVALEEARIAGDIFKNSFEKAEAVIREARVLWGQGQEKQAVWKLESYLSGASSRTEAALASPKAERKTFCLECGSDEIGYVTQADRDAATKNKPSVLKAVRQALAKSQPAHVVESPTVSIDDVVSVYLPKSQPAEKEKP